ncbi:hypothetical protein ABT247_31840 [Kitasatospora sp. NPDC001539]|uniref:hypothetical protein n=1 Tax=unclassified Kitasatospora TaxID=2633591 RepID=UPI003316C20E
MRNILKTAAALALGGALALGVSGQAFAAGGPANLAGKGCPSSYSNNADGGTYIQTLTKKFVAPNGFQYGDYSVVFYNSAGIKSTLPVHEYRCY